jgi:hypothetical protein
MKKFFLIVLAVLATSAFPATRSQSARLAFVRQTACPATGLHKLPCKGYVIDHVIPLACGGADAPSNMQWQTVADGKAKDKVERIGCKKK